MKKFLLTAVFAFIGTLVFAQQRYAVFPFEDRDNVLTRNEIVRFFREFSNVFANQSAGRFSVVPQQDVERLINIQAAFRISDFSAQVKTAEMNRVLNGTRIISGSIFREGNNIRIFPSLIIYPEMIQPPSAIFISVANTNELFNRIPELVQRVSDAIIRSEQPPSNRDIQVVPPPSDPSPPISPIPFIHIQGGTFTMGSPSNEPQRSNNEIQHQVTVNSFYMSRHEVTQREWYEVMGTTLQQQSYDQMWRILPLSGEGDNYPMYNVSWYDAVEYCNRRSEREGLRPAYTIDKSRNDPNNHSEYAYDTVRWLVTWNRNANGYRLPTEAEWEYACRAGTVTPFSTGNNITTSQANYDGNFSYDNNPRGTYRESTTAVESFAPNPWGLYDMHGNVYEWCWDWNGDYTSRMKTDPQGAVSGSGRVARGGSWASFGVELRSAYRRSNTPSDQSHLIGFRLVRNAQ